jgi:hypothetical protein
MLMKLLQFAQIVAHFSLGSFAMQIEDVGGTALMLGSW